MQDPRALANWKSLESYRAWERDSLWRSGFVAIFLIVPMSVPMFTFPVSLIEDATKGDAGALVLLMGAAFALYLVTLGTLTLFAVLRLKAWKRSHPWAPPSL
jgi:hypothetical protein